jgi:hypothetical protein
MRFSLNVYFFFLLDVFFAVFFAAFAVFFAFFAFLAMFPSVIPKVWLNANRHSTCIHSDYTIIAKLIPRASKRVNGRHTSATCDRAKPLRDASRGEFWTGTPLSKICKLSSRNICADVVWLWHFSDIGVLTLRP